MNRKQVVFNICFFLVLAVLITWETYKQYVSGSLHFIEISFTVQNLVMLVYILIRRPHQGVDPRLFNQAVALTAYCSGIAFMGGQAVKDSMLITISTAIVFVSNILGIVTLFNLGRSFGVLIAYREIKTSGLYAVVRHPMYGTDILLRIGFIVSHFNLITVLVFVASSSCYVYRAILEEKFLSRQECYRQYMEKVKYRFIPGVF